MTAKNEFLIMKALNFKYVGTNDTGDILEHLVETGELDGVEHVALKNVCAKLSVTLVDEVDNVCSILGMSKRAFIERALTSLIQEFEEIADEYDIYAPHISADKASGEGA